MNSVRQSCRPKHQVLILKCYPRFQKGVHSVKPNSSELSYLLYYACTRRSKLPKLGAFLEKRAARDVWRGKTGNVQVTLQILAALIEKVPRDLPLYARSVLTVLDTIQRSQEITIVEESTATFEVFCRYQDNATLSAGQEYMDLYRNVIQAYANFASVDSASTSKSPLSKSMVLRWKSVGLEAIKSLVSSESVSLDGTITLGIAVPVILQNLYASDDPTLSSLQQQAQTSEKNEREQARKRRMSVGTVQTVDTVDANRASASGTTADADKAAELEARVTALRCLEKVFTPTSNRGQIHTAISLVLDYVVSRRPPRRQNVDRSAETHFDGNWATDLLEIIVEWTPVQDRFVILLTLMESMTARALTREQLRPQLTLASLADWLLCSPTNLVGLSVVDVLLELLQYLLRLLRHGSNTSRDAAASSGPAPNKPNSHDLEKIATAGSDQDANEAAKAETLVLRRELVELMQKCIGDLATHIYYADQVSDMIRTIISRVKPSTPPEESNDDASPKAAKSGQDNSPHDMSFPFPAARASALKAVKDIFIVANLRKSLAGGSPDSRNQVPIQVWEGTQWLFRDSVTEVRYAYVDAILSWLQLETNKDDLKAPPEVPRQSKLPPIRDVDSPDPYTRRVASLGPPREKATANAASPFVQLLHLVVYETASDPSAKESDILVLHLLLANLVEHMGVNAARHGLPVMMRLQDDYLSDAKDYSPTNILHISSLVHGYLWALVEKFNLEGTKVGNEIINETLKRRQRGLWVEKVQLPPRPLNNIVPVLDSAANRNRSSASTKDAYTPFKAVSDLVQQIEKGYITSIASLAASPAGSPTRVLAVSPLAQQYSASAPSKSFGGPAGLPPYIKEQMLSPWSKEACLAALENEKAKSSSISGSRNGTGASGARIHLALANGYKSGNGAWNVADSPTNNHAGQHSDRPISSGYNNGLGGIHKARRQSIAGMPMSPGAGSSRDSTVRVNELRRVLSAVNSTDVRQPSPLRGLSRLGSDISSADSLVTGNFSASDVDVSGAGAGRDGAKSLNEDSETPRASTAHVANGEGHDKVEASEGQRPDDIPPVPPLPSTLAIPGGFPVDSASATPVTSPSHSPVRSDRPRTAPSTNAAPANGQGSLASTVRHSRSFTRQTPGTDDYNRSFSLPRKPSIQRHLSKNAAGPDATSSTAPEKTIARSASQRLASGGSRNFSLGRPTDVETLLDGLISDDARKQGSVQPTKSKAPVPFSPARRPSTRSRARNPYNLSIDVEDWPQKHGGPSTAASARITSGHRGGIGPPPY